jgi:glycosyltransferase involved in cell wall biosynthesis
MISIIIPLYNKEANIKKTLKSVLAQNYSNFELIIVNDGSTDKSVEVINSSFNDSRIQIINQENKGASVARNRGVEASKFNYISFIDADDEWEPDYLSKIIESIKLFPMAEMFCTAGILRSESGAVTYRAKKNLFNAIKIIDFFKNPYFYTNTSSVVVTKSIFLASGKFPENLKSNEDIACLHKLSLLTQVVYCGKPLSIYNRGIDGHLSSVVHHSVPVNLISRINYVHAGWVATKCLNKWYLYFIKNEIRSEILKYLKVDKHESVKYIVDNIDNDLSNRFSKFELNIYKRKELKPLSYFIIYAKKIIFKIRTSNY